jgi:DNA-binding NtrC family response regulator
MSQEAIAALNEQHFDILVTDLKMSGPDGMDVLQAAKQAQPDIKPVVITGFATRETADEAMRRGAAAFIAKPFRMSHLRDVLLKLVDEVEDNHE